MEASAVATKEGEYFSSDFESACQDYLSKYLKRCESFGETYMFPACFPVHYEAPIGEASGAMSLTVKDKVDMKGQNAEYEIFRALINFGRQEQGIMFVLHGFKFNLFTPGSPSKKKLSSEKLQSDDKKKLDHLKDIGATEMDFVVIHKQGVVLIEVKATEKFVWATYSKAKDQLKTAKEFMVELGVPKNIIFTVVAMPNVSHAPEHADDFIDLRSCHLKSDKTFKCWWKEKFSSSLKSEEQQGITREPPIKDPHKLTAVLVGQRAAICAKDSVAKVLKTIDCQDFKKNKKKEKPAVQKLRSAEQSLILNPAQLEVWEGPTRQLIYGVTGGGKTILLQYKALYCACAMNEEEKGSKYARNEEPIVVFAPAPLDSIYRQFFKKNKVSTDLFVVVDFTKISQFVEKHTTQCHIFIDEFQTLSSTVDSLVGFMAKRRDDQYYQWIAYDFNQHRDMSLLHSNIVKLCKELEINYMQILTTVMRNTCELFDFLLGYLRNYSDYAEIEKQDIKISDIKLSTKELESPRHDFSMYWKHVFYIGHRVSGPEVCMKPHKSSDPPLELFVQKLLLDELEIWTDDDSKVADYSKVAVLVQLFRYHNPRSDIPFKSSLVDTLTQSIQKKVPVHKIGGTEDAVVVDYVENARSCEWPTVIAVIEANVSSPRSYLAYSRAMIKLVVVHPEGEPPLKGNDYKPSFSAPS